MVNSIWNSLFVYWIDQRSAYHSWYMVISICIRLASVDCKISVHLYFGTHLNKAFHANKPIEFILYLKPKHRELVVCMLDFDVMIKLITINIVVSLFDTYYKIINERTHAVFSTTMWRITLVFWFHWIGGFNRRSQPVKFLLRFLSHSIHTHTQPHSHSYAKFWLTLIIMAVNVANRLLN